MRRSGQPSSRWRVVRTAEFTGAPDGLDRVHALLHEFWLAVDESPETSFDHRRRTRFEIAVIEIATNVVRYALHGDIESTSPRLELCCESDTVRARFTDSGRMLAADVNLDACRMPATEDLAESGYGLPLVRRCVDTVSYRRTCRGENVWLLELGC